MPSIAPPGVREMRTPDLYTLRAGSAVECLPPPATAAVREPLCRDCPLTEICTEIHTRETATSVYDAEATTTARADIASAAPVSRPRGIRPALGWRERRTSAAGNRRPSPVRTADTGLGGKRP